MNLTRNKIQYLVKIQTEVKQQHIKAGTSLH